MYTHVDIRTHARDHRHAHAHTHTHTHTPRQTDMYTHVDIRTHARHHRHARTHTHTHTHTHTQQEGTMNAEASLQREKGPTLSAQGGLPSSTERSSAPETPAPWGTAVRLRCSTMLRAKRILSDPPLISSPASEMLTLIQTDSEEGSSESYAEGKVNA